VMADTNNPNVVTLKVDSDVEVEVDFRHRTIRVRAPAGVPVCVDPPAPVTRVIEQHSTPIQ